MAGLDNLRIGMTGMKFIAFVIVVLAALFAVSDDTQFCLLVGGAYAVLCGANVANTRKALAVGVSPSEVK